MSEEGIKGSGGSEAAQVVNHKIQLDCTAEQSHGDGAGWRQKVHLRLLYHVTGEYV